MQPGWADDWADAITGYMYQIQPRLVGDCAIAVGETDVTPVASHLFALLLALTLEPRELWTRRGLQELLFASAEETQASHRLRQLLYRLRAFGVAITEEPDGLLRVVNPIGDPLPGLAPSSAPEGPGDESPSDVLAHYAPRLPAPYLEWLERRRDALLRTLTARRVAQLRAARERQDWTTTARIAEGLERADALTEEIVVAAAEAQAMLGHRDAAVDVIDRFVRESDHDIAAHPALRRLRTRILNTRIVQREGTLRGREECLVFLGDQWHQAVAGQGGRACAVFGPPGMGKSRVGEVFAASTRLGGGIVVSYRCDSQNRHAPLTLFSQLVRDLRNMRGSLGADPELRATLDDLAPEQPIPLRTLDDVDRRRDEMRRAIVDLMEAVTAEQSLLVVIDDAHLLDDASRAVVRSIADSANAARVLILLLCRPRPDDFTLVSSARRFSTYTLPPLSEADSRSLVLELAGSRPLSENEIQWSVGQAAGNAFYLHALAHNPCGSESLPAHIRSLAHTSYLSLTPDARTVLDACLLLDTLATPGRVARASSLDDRTLLGTLRELEESDLLRYEEGLFVGPHAIVRDALVDLIPTATAAILHRRIATLLSDECAHPGQARGVAWAAVSSWLVAGDPASAAKLALKVARDAASFGEPEMGAALLDRVPRQELSFTVQRELLDEIIQLAEAGRCTALMTQALTARAALATVAAEGRNAIASLTVRAVAAKLTQHVAYDAATLQRLIKDASLEADIRFDAAARLIAIADLHFDLVLAHETFSFLARSYPKDHARTSFLRARLIYDTSFGDRRRAVEVTQRLLAAFPEPNGDDEPRRSRSYALLALLRLGHYDRAALVGEADWQYFSSHGNRWMAEYSGCLTVESYLNMGQFDRAKSLFSRIEDSFKNRPQPPDSRCSIHESVRIILAMIEGDYLKADVLLSNGQLYREWNALAPRTRAVALSYRVRLAQLRRDAPNSYVVEQRQMLELFAQGRRFAAHDGIAEAVWHAMVAAGNEAGASSMLCRYLSERREMGAPEALFRQSTRTDPSWAKYPPRQIESDSQCSS